ncbi:MAG TPA: D-2-hydroxyacid dehydrogenase [Chloroflexia bacterium]|nr:D-2-hydroxyacid dehydrogenase [Chloroflexia bacterium]
MHDTSLPGGPGEQPLDAPKVPILVNFTLSDQYLAEIEAVDPRVEVLRGYERADDDARARGEEASVVEGDALLKMVRRAEVLFSFRFPVEWLDNAPDLKWVQLASAGSDHMLREGVFLKRPDLILTTASGVHEIPISEHILAMILHFSRGFNIAARNQAQSKWERYRADEAYDKKVCMVGYGPIARRAATMCKALGMVVVSVRASIAEQQPSFEAVDRFYPPAELNDVLAQSDYVVVAAPRTPQSERMIGKSQFEAMKEGAVLVNISRGALVDEAAMIEALQGGKLKGAALDVFEREPLREDSPLWKMPNVLITPHVSGSNPHYDRRVTDLFCDNLARYLKGEQLRNKVESERGY